MAFDVVDYTDNLGPFVAEVSVDVLLDLDPLSQCGLSRPGRARQHVVNYDYTPVGSIVEGIEVTAVLEVPLGGLEITRGDGSIVGEKISFLDLIKSLGAIGAVPVRVVVKWQMGYRAHRLHAWNRRELLFKLANKARSLDALPPAGADFES